MVAALTTRYPFQTWGVGKTKGYAGIALLSKVKPTKVTTGLPASEADTKGRVITAEFERYILCGTYVVNAGEKLKSMEEKIRWNESFAKHLAECDARKPTIWLGDLNVVMDARDLSKASEKWNKSPGYTAIECNHHRRVLDGTAAPGAQQYVDIWRERNPDAIGHFSEFAPPFESMPLLSSDSGRKTFLRSLLRFPWHVSHKGDWLAFGQLHRSEAYPTRGVGRRHPTQRLRCERSRANLHGHQRHPLIRRCIDHFTVFYPSSVIHSVEEHSPLFFPTTTWLQI